MAVNADGDLTAAWIGTDPDTEHTVVRSKSRPAGGAWSATATDLSSDAGDASDVQVAVDPQGDATAAWSYREDGDIVVQAAHRNEGSGTWSSPAELWDDVADTVRPEIALASDPQGSATAIWSSFGAGGHVMRSSTSADGGPWSSPVALSAPDGSDNAGMAVNPRIVADPEGDLTATWTAAVGPGTGANQRLWAAHRPAGEAWGSPVALSAIDDLWAAEIAVDPQGYVTTLWIGASAVISRVFDPVAPLLDDVTVPASGVVGEPVAMSVDPFDVWSPVATSWDFGDGGSGSGTAVSHCYDSPGERTVTVSGVDGVGNATSVPRTIEIEADPDAGSDPCAPPTPDPDPGPGPDPGPPPGGDPGPGPRTDPGATAPVLSGLEQSSARWRTRAGGRRPRLAVGTTFRFKLDRRARVRLEFFAIATGRRVGARCVKPRKANRGRPRCTRHLARGTLSVAGRAGANAYAFRGKIGHRTLAPGRYRLRATALADGKRSAPVTIAFTIAR